LDLDINLQPFDVVVDIDLGTISLTDELGSQMESLLVREPSKLTIKVFSMFSPTLVDSMMDVLISLGGTPLLLFDPEFIN